MNVSRCLFSTTASSQPHLCAHPPDCHPERSEGSAFPSLAAYGRSSIALAPPTPFVATPAVSLQLAGNPATLSPVPATLTCRVKPNPFVCHSYEKHPGVGVSRQILPVSNSSILSVNSALSCPAFTPNGSERQIPLPRLVSLPPSLTPTESALAKNAPVNRLESALPKHST
jgi:hypothetical protein